MLSTRPEEPISVIESPSMTNNDTWNDCPVCHKAWKDDIGTPGLIHRTIICQSCAFKRSQESIN